MRILIYVILVAVLSSVSLGSDYFSRITMASDGRVTRFSHTPITVYVETPPVSEVLQDAYIGDVEYALNQWEGCSEGHLEFKRIDSEEADIKICWTKDLVIGGADPLGRANLVRLGSGKFYVKVHILMQKRPSLESSAHKELKSVILHELGHAIGLWGHSPDPYDIMYPESIAIHPTRRDKNTLLMLLRARSDSPLYESAIAELKSDISAKPDAAYLHFWLGAVYADKGDDDLAIEEFLTALRLSPNLIDAAHRLGKMFEEEGMYGKAIAYYSREAELEPSPGLYGIIGMLYYRQDEYDKAIQYFKKALQIDPDFTAAEKNALAAYHLWASKLIKDGKAGEAIPVLVSALEMFPSSRVINYDMGIAYDTSGEYEKAVDYYKKALKFDPDFVAAKSNIAGCMNSLGAEQIQCRNWVDSISFFKQALEWDPEFWEARKNLETATFQLGKEKHESGFLDEAIEYYRNVLDMNSEDINVYNSLGYALYEKGLYKDAQAQFQTALDIDPESYDSKAGLAIVKRKINTNRAKIAIFLTLVSMFLCISIISLSKYRHRGKLVEKSGAM